MRERFFESGRIDNKKAIQRDLEDAGVKDTSQWRNALDLERTTEEKEGFVPKDVQKRRHPEAGLEVKTGKIEDENWQKQLDIAFEQGDYKLIQTLRRVRPESIPDQKMIRNKMHELVVSRPKTWVEDVVKIRSMFNVDIDPAILSTEFAKLFERLGKERGVLEQLKIFKEATRYAPSFEQVQTKYRDFFDGKKDRSFGIEILVQNLKNLTGIQPDTSIFQQMLDKGDILQAKKFAPIFGLEITSEMIQQAYEAEFLVKGCLNTSSIEEIGENPNSDLVQRAYKIIMKEQRDGWFFNIESLKKVTGIKPVLTTEEMRPIFESFLSKGWYGKSDHIGVENLIEMTGVKPLLDLVQKTALRAIDKALDEAVYYEADYSSSGRGIQERLNRLRESVSVDFEIPESEIQARYQQAITKKNPQNIINLYGAFGIKPAIDREQARRFMVEYIDVVYENPILELEKIFGFKPQATQEEIEAKQDEDLEKYEFDKIAKIRELTGKKCAKSKLKAAFAKLLEIEATTPPHDRAMREEHWQKKIKQHLKQFALKFNPETVIPIYSALAQNEVIYTENFSKIFELTGVPLPPELAQHVCKKILAPDYVAHSKNQRGYSYYYDVPSALSVMYQISLERPAVSREYVQSYYKSQLRLDSSDAEQKISKISEITGIQPQWNPVEVHSVYKNLILNDKEDSVKRVNKITGIKPVLDKETLTYVLDKLESSIETVGAIDYKNEEYRLWNAAYKIKNVISATGAQPNPERLQFAYTEILKNDPYWQVKISQLVESTGVVPKIPHEHIQVRGGQLLQNNDMRAFQQLLKYGDFVYTPTIVEKTYAALLAASDTQNTGNRNYNENWVEDIRRFKELSGTAPTNVQLNELFSRLVTDSKFVRSRRMTGVLDFYITEFGTTISKEHAQLAYKELFATGNLIGIEELKKKIGIAPEIPTDIMREKCNFWLKSRDFQTLKYVKLFFGLETIPISPEVVQAEYHNLIKNPAFADSNHKDTAIFYALFDCTGVRPEFTPEQLSMAYQKVMAAATDGNYDAFERVVGVPPKAIDLQKQIIKWMDRYGQKENIAKFIARNTVVRTPEAISNICLHILEKASVAEISSIKRSLKLIEDIFGTRVRLEASSVEGIFKKILETDKDVKLDVLFPWFEELAGQKPPQNLVDIAYKITLGKEIFNDSKEGDGRFGPTWDWLKKRYGLPSQEAVQAVYLAELSSNNSTFLEYIQQSTKIKPDIKEMAYIEKAKGADADEQQIYLKLQNLFEKELMQGNAEEIKKMENQFGHRMKIEVADLQILYTRILMVDDARHQRSSFKFVLERTGIAPSPEIIHARYRELFAQQSPEDIRAFKEMVEVPPMNEIVQDRYREIFRKYIEHDEGLFFEEYTKLVQFTGIRPQFDRDYVMKLYEYCVSSVSEYHQKFIDIIAQETGIKIDRDFIQKYILDNPSFCSPVSLSIATDQLAEHFSHPKNVNLAEYKRIYQIFGCFEYYQNVLAALEQEQTKESKQRIIAILTAMGVRDSDNEERYIATKKRLMSFVHEKSSLINKSLGEALAELVKNNDVDLLNYFADILRERTKTAGNSDEERGILGFSAVQEVALRTLFHLDNPVANERLFALVFVDDIDSRVRSLILKNLITQKSEFFPPHMKAWLKTLVIDGKKQFSLDDLKYFQAINHISSSDLRVKSLKYLNDVFGMCRENTSSPSELQKQNHRSIPDNIFLSLWKFTRGDQVLLEKFDGLYKLIKSTSEKDELLFGVVNSLSINQKLLNKVVVRLGKTDLTLPDTAHKLSAVLKTLSFLAAVEQNFEQSQDETLDLLDSHADSLASLHALLKKAVIRKIKEVLPHEAVNTDSIQSLWEHWGNLEPIFIYAAKMSANDNQGTLELVAETVANMDAPQYDGWKTWRYNTRNRHIKDQVGHLDQNQLAVWRSDHFAELGDVMIAATPSDKPKQIFRFLEGALREGHIYHEHISSSDRHKFIQEKLQQAYRLISEHPTQKETILNGAVEMISADIEKIDSIIRFSTLPKLEQTLLYFAEGKTVPINAKSKNLVGFLSQFLSKERIKEVEKNYREAETNNLSGVVSDRIIDVSVREILKNKVDEIKKKYQEILETEFFSQYGLKKDELKNIGQFYQKRQEFKALVDLYRISAIDVKKIATNRISDHFEEKNETLTKVVSGLKTYFKDNPAFVQDIENINAVISQREDLGAKRRLAMIVTDNPQMLFQVGKYPLGSGSCQNYAGSPDWNKSLAGYVADAHIKVSYLVDLNKLPDHIKQEIESRGFSEVKESIPHQDLLEASIARSVIKMTKINTTDEPALFIEPTYTSINKGDLSMDKYFNIFLELMVSDPMKIRLVRGGGSERVRVPKSRNPSGQYEDGANGNAGDAGMGIQTGSYTMSARFINKLTPITEADRKLAARISGEIME